MANRPAAEHAKIIQAEMEASLQRLRAAGIPATDYRITTTIHQDEEQARYWEDLAGRLTEPKMIVEAEQRAASLREKE